MSIMSDSLLPFLTNSTRLAIYVCFDEKGEIDRSKTYFLDDLVKNIDELIIVANGGLSEEGRRILKERYGNRDNVSSDISQSTGSNINYISADNNNDHSVNIANTSAIATNSINKVDNDNNRCKKLIILEREDEGFDPWGYKYGMEHVGYDYLSKFDEIIHVNDSCFGPIYPFKEMFDEMDKRNVDFWGITRYDGRKLTQHDSLFFKEDIIPPYLETYFTVYRKNVFSSEIFKTFWKNIPLLDSADKAVYQHEIIIMRFFNHAGFKSDTYINNNSTWLSPCILYDLQEELIKRKSPIIKKRAFYQPYSQWLYNSGRQAYEAFNYIKKYTNYDINIIWDYLLKKHPQTEWRKILHLNYIISHQTRSGLSGYHKKIALVMHLYYENLLNDCFEYIKSMPRYSDVYITTSKTNIKEQALEKLKAMNFNYYEVRTVQNRGRLESALLIECKDIFLDKGYDYICYAHDKKIDAFPQATVDYSFFKKSMENILKSEVFIENVIETFENNERLGLLYSPPPFHAAFSSAIANKSDTSYNLLLKVLKQINVNTKIIKNDLYAAVGSYFWCKPQALRKLFMYNWQYNDFPLEPMTSSKAINYGIEKNYSYTAQDAGYYSGWLLNEDYIKTEMTNLFHYLTLTNATLTFLNYNSIGNLSKKLIKLILKKFLPHFVISKLRRIKKILADFYLS